MYVRTRYILPGSRYVTSIRVIVAAIMMVVLVVMVVVMMIISKSVSMEEKQQQQKQYTKTKRNKRGYRVLLCQYSPSCYAPFVVPHAYDSDYQQCFVSHREFRCIEKLSFRHVTMS